MNPARTGRGRPVTNWAVRVLMRRIEDGESRWGIPRWDLLAVLPDPDPPNGIERRLVHAQAGQHDFEWSGMRVPLFRDAAESYWYNLVGREPSLCVICRPGEDIDLEPFAVTANHDEAGAHMETDDTVFRAPLPQEFLAPLEEFVMTHYEPAEPRKRRRRNWAAEASDDKGPRSGPAGD